MHRLSSLFVHLSLLLLLSCTPQTPQPGFQISLFVYRFHPPAFIEFSKDFEAIGEIPFSLPPNCGLFNIFPAPLGKFMVVELSCPNGQTVLFLDTDTAAVTQPITDADSHFLAWRFDGSAAFLRVDSLGNPRVLRVWPGGTHDLVSNAVFTYDLASSLNQGEYTFTFSRGLGRGSELWLARSEGKVVEQLYADQYNYISFVRFSPDGRQLAFIKIPDNQTPFTVGELWVIPSTAALQENAETSQDEDGSNARKLAAVDAGHGYAANWSPDGERIAFVVRENPEDRQADQSSDALISNIYMVEVKSGELTQVTHFESGRVETPVWSPEGNTLAFNKVINDRMEVRIADLTTGEIQPLTVESTCCPAWVRK